MPERRPAFVYEPVLSQWPSLLERGLAAARAQDRERGAVLFSLALEYTKRLLEIATERGISSLPLERYRIFVEDSHRFPGANVLVGHQPVIYYPGLLEKNLRTSELSSNSSAATVNVIIDSDAGDGAQVAYPELRSPGLARLRRASFGIGPEIYLAQSVGASAEVANVFEAVLQAGGPRINGGLVRQTAEGYGRLSGVPVAAANSLMRLLCEPDRRYLEVPLSVLARAAPSAAFFSRILSDPKALFYTYNATLDAFRAAHGIDNPANPFPNLRQDGDYFEMPLWILDPVQGERKVVGITERNGQRLLFAEGSAVGRADAEVISCTGDQYLVPRGALITLFLRTSACSLFVHGLGGAKYEPLVDLLAERWLGQKLAPFVAASSTRYLLEPDLVDYEESLHWRRDFRNVISHTALYLGRGLFETADERRLAELSAERRGLLSDLAAVQGGRPERSRILHQLNRVNRGVRAIVDQSAIHEMANRFDPPPDVLEAMYYRQYPCFLFP